jgi:hypothetical protein
MYRLINKSNAMVTLDDGIKIPPRGQIEVLNLTPDAPILVMRNIIQIDDLGGVNGYTYKVENISNQSFQWEHGSLAANATAYVTNITPGLSDALARSWVTITPVGNSGSSGGIAIESDPTVTSVLQNALGTPTGFTGKGAAVSVVSAMDLGTVLDINTTEPGKVSVKTMVGSTSIADGQRGLVPRPLIADRNSFLKGDGTWSAPPATLSGHSAAANYASGDLVVYNGYVLKANAAITPSAVSWGTFGATWSPLVDSAKVWRGVFTSLVAYAVNDIVAKVATGGTLLQVTTATLAGETPDTHPEKFQEFYGSVVESFVGATSTLKGKGGLVPDPLVADRTKLLKGNGTWSEVAPVWTVATPYNIGDFVSHQGTMYVCSTAHTSNASTFLTDHGNWSVLGTRANIVTTTAVIYTVLEADSMVVTAAPSASQSVYLPAIAAGMVRDIVIKRSLGTASNTILFPNGVQTIEGAAQYTLYDVGDVLTLRSDGVSNWVIISNISSVPKAATSIADKTTSYVVTVAEAAPGTIVLNQTTNNINFNLPSGRPAGATLNVLHKGTATGVSINNSGVLHAGEYATYISDGSFFRPLNGVVQGVINIGDKVAPYTFSASEVANNYLSLNQTTPNVAFTLPTTQNDGTRVVIYHQNAVEGVTINGIPTIPGTAMEFMHIFGWKYLGGMNPKDTPYSVPNSPINTTLTYASISTGMMRFLQTSDNVTFSLPATGPYVGFRLTCFLTGTALGVRVNSYYLPRNRHLTFLWTGTEWGREENVDAGNIEVTDKSVNYTLLASEITDQKVVLQQTTNNIAFTLPTLPVSRDRKLTVYSSGSATGVTVNGSAISQGKFLDFTFTVAGGWQVARTSGVLNAVRSITSGGAASNTPITAVAGEQLFITVVDSTATVVITPPIAPAAGDRFAVTHVSGSVVGFPFIYNVTVPFSATTLYGNADTFQMDVALSTVHFVYTGTTWTLSA